jgi:hypothetical protein
VLTTLYEKHVQEYCTRPEKPILASFHRIKNVTSINDDCVRIYIKCLYTKTRRSRWPHGLMCGWWALTGIAGSNAADGMDVCVL